MLIDMVVPPLLLLGLQLQCYVARAIYMYNALINVTHSGQKEHFIGRYAFNSKAQQVAGYLVHVRSEDNDTHGCTWPMYKSTPLKPWIGLLRRGNCSYQQKVDQFQSTDATAIIIYDTVSDNLMTIELHAHHVLAVFVGKTSGRRMASLADSGDRVYVEFKPVIYVPQSPKIKTTLVGVAHTVLLPLGLLFLVCCSLITVCVIRRLRKNNEIEVRQLNVHSGTQYGPVTAEAENQSGNE